MIDPLSLARCAAATVVVAGAGPVGTCAAIELARRGIKVVVVEPRGPGEPPSAKCNTVAAKTMETFRRFGIADAVRAAGLSDDYPTDVMYATSVGGFELTRIVQPSRNERHLDGYPDSHWRTPEPVVRVSQLFLEPVMFSALSAQPNVTVINRASVVRYEQTQHQVTAHCETVDGARFAIDCEYFIGCDGGRSVVRKQMGARLVGDAELGRTRTSLVRSAAIKTLFDGRRPAWMSWIVNDKIRGTAIAIDGDQLWLLHRNMADSATPFEGLDSHQSILDLLGVDDLEYEVVHHEDWVGRRLVADRFRDGRVFIAGDAAHLWIPFAGYGMNAGIADGVTLAWVLAAVLNGWGDPAMLDAYEAERHPITEQVSRLAMASVLANNAAMGGSVPPVLSEDSTEGAAIRASLGARLRDANISQFAPEGLNFGYFYDASPLIAYDDATAPSYTMGTITASTVPGCRLPHFDIDGRPLIDHLGADYTLIRFDPAIDVTALLNAAAIAHVPITVVDAARPDEPAVFQHSLLLARFDQHVVWRGDRLPMSCRGLIERLRGALSLEGLRA